MDSKKRLVIIDGNAILHRAYHALPEMTNQKGEYTNAVYGFVSMLLGLIDKLQPTHLAVCFDEKEETFRKKQFKNYQAKRPPMDPFLVSQISKTREFLKISKIAFYSKSGFEADDVIGTIASRCSEISNFQFPISNKKHHSPTTVHQPLSTNHNPQIDEVVIVSGDRDLFQLITDKVKVYVPIKGLKEGKLYGEEEVKKEFDFAPIQMIDYKALVGDSSDNYPGVSGIGPKTARELIVRYGTVESIFENIGNLPQNARMKLKNNKKEAFFFKKLATIKNDVEVGFNLDDCKYWNFGEETSNLLGEFGFRSLRERVVKFQNRTTKNSRIKYSGREKVVTNKQEALF